MGKKAYIILENGSIFEGVSFGYEAEVTGELVFTTGMAGYLETLTDPAFSGQIVIQTFPLIGNYGVIPADFEGDKPALSGYVVREVCSRPSNFRSEGVLDDWLGQNKIPGICGIDTRALTKIVREHGVMKAKISFSQNGSELFDCEEVYEVERVSTGRRETLECKNAERTVVFWDFGAPRNTSFALTGRGCRVIRLPHDASAEEILAQKPNGVFLSSGPGDPMKNTKIIEELKKLYISKTPLFGVGLGHQLLALAAGAKTDKLKYGHRGANQPVVDTDTGRVFITSQNHGYIVLESSLPKNAKMKFKNGNDGTCEGISYTDIPAFSVQFRPETLAAPLNTGFLFDEFITLMKEAGK